MENLNYTKAATKFLLRDDSLRREDFLNRMENCIAAARTAEARRRLFQVAVSLDDYLEECGW
jgi:hypothetical protein